MPKAMESPTTPSASRRTLLGAALSATALPLAAVPALSAPAVPVAPDPVLALAAEREAVLAGVAPLTSRISDLGAALIRRYAPAGAALDSWLPLAAHDDAQHAERAALLQARDHVENRAADLMLEMLVTRATTVAGVVAKLNGALVMVEHVEPDLPPEALTCLAVMRDTVRVLSGREAV